MVNSSETDRNFCVCFPLKNCRTLSCCEHRKTLRRRMTWRKEPKGNRSKVKGLHKHGARYRAWQGAEKTGGWIHCEGMRAKRGKRGAVEWRRALFSALCEDWTYFCEESGRPPGLTDSCFFFCVYFARVTFSVLLSTKVNKVTTFSRFKNSNLRVCWTNIDFAKNNFLICFSF